MNKIHFHPGRSLCHAGLTGGMSLNTEIVIPLSLRLTTTKQLHKLCIQRYHINMIHHPSPTCIVPHRFDRCNQNVKGYNKYKFIVTSKCLPNQLASSASIIRTAAQLQKVQHQKLNIMLTPGTATTRLLSVQDITTNSSQERPHHHRCKHTQLPQTTCNTDKWMTS